MTFEEAIQAHCNWRLELAERLSDPDRPAPDPEILAVDDRCALGQWLHGEGAPFAMLEEWQVLLLEHAHFHATAAEVARCCGNGHPRRVDAALAPGGAFHDASKRTIHAIKRLRDRIRREAHAGSIG